MPLVIFGLLSLLGSILAIFLPETAGINLPQSLDEGEQFAMDSQPKICCCCTEKDLAFDN